MSKISWYKKFSVGIILKSLIEEVERLGGCVDRYDKEGRVVHHISLTPAYEETEDLNNLENKVRKAILCHQIYRKRKQS